MTDETLAAACRLVADVLSCSPHSVRGDDRVGSLPGWDSIAHIHIVLAFEENLGRSLTAEEIGTAKTVADFARFLKAKRSAMPG